jgi:hypothetical protein
VKMRRRVKVTSSSLSSWSCGGGGGGSSGGSAQNGGGSDGSGGGIGSEVSMSFQLLEKPRCHSGCSTLPPALVVEKKKKPAEAATAAAAVETVTAAAEALLPPLLPHTLAAAASVASPCFGTADARFSRLSLASNPTTMLTLLQQHFTNPLQHARREIVSSYAPSSSSHHGFDQFELLAVDTAIGLVAGWQHSWEARQQQQQQQEQELEEGHQGSMRRDGDSIASFSGGGGDYGVSGGCGDGVSGDSGGGGDGSGAGVFLYQIGDGRRVFLHPINVKCLQLEYGAAAAAAAASGDGGSADNVAVDASTGADGSSNIPGSTINNNSSSSSSSSSSSNTRRGLPRVVSGVVVEVEEGVKVTHELRRRCAFLRHLPLHCDVTFVELDVSCCLLA